MIAMATEIQMNNLQDICTAVWGTNCIETKKNLLRKAVLGFKFKGKTVHFMQQIAASNAKKLDQLASNLILNNGDKVVDLLPR